MKCDTLVLCKQVIAGEVLVKYRCYTLKGGNYIHIALKGLIDVHLLVRL